MSKKSLTLLIVGFSIFLVLILIIAGVFAAYLINKNDNKDKTDTNIEEISDTDNADDSDQSAATTRDLYAIVNCKLYKLGPTKVTQINFTNKTKVKCFANRVIRNNYAIIRPTYESLILPGVGDKNIFMINLDAKSIVEIKYTTDSSHTALYDPVNKKLYTYIVGTGIYTGTLTKPLTTKIFTSSTEIFGRGGMFGDELALRLNESGNKLAIIDTLTSVNKDGTSYKSLRVIDNKGLLLFSDYGTFAEWINKSKIIYYVNNTEGGEEGDVKVYNFDKSTAETINGLTNVAHFDALGSYIIVDSFKTAGQYKTNDMKTTILNIKDYTVANSSITKKSDNYLLDMNTVVGHSTVDCSGEWDSGAKYACSLDGGLDYYEKSLVAHDINTGKDTPLIVFTTAQMGGGLD